MHLIDLGEKESIVKLLLELMKVINQINKSMFNITGLSSEYTSTIWH